MEMTAEDLERLRYAKSLLENPSLAAKITNLIGAPIEKGFDLLPARWSDAVGKSTQEALQKALGLALTTLDETTQRSSSDIFHKILVSVAGAGGGAFGLPALAIELPISTTIMLRSIADIARSHGEDIQDPMVKIECIQVFALGGISKGDDAAEAGYFAVRASMARAVSEAAEHIAQRGLGQQGAPVIVRFISQVASRFGIVVSEKAAAQAIPVIGATGGALINSLFINHFQEMARGHFLVRRLERKYGPDVVKERYEKL